MIWIIVLTIWSFALVGYALRRRWQPSMDVPVRLLVWLLLFLVGWEVGADRSLVRSWRSLGADALCVTLLTVVSCAVGARLFLRCVRVSVCAPPAGGRRPAGTLWANVRSNLVYVGFFLVGGAISFSSWFPPLPAGASSVALFLLLAAVGFHIGQSDTLRASLRRVDRRLLLLPFVTIVSTWAGALLTSIVLPHHTVAEWLAVGSGFGYYSLSGILISEAISPALGTIAIAHNILRELCVLLGAPFLARLCGPLAPVSVGGATSGDTSLPAIAAASGSVFVPLSIYHGVAVDFTVPFLVSFFCSL